MDELLFFSRHEPTDNQHRLAKEAGYNISWEGDLDAFDTGLAYDVIEMLYENESCWDNRKPKSVAVVHPLLALEFAAHPNVKEVCVFENRNRDGEFKAVALHKHQVDHIGEDGIHSNDAPF